MRTDHQTILVLGAGLSGCAAADLAVHNRDRVVLLDESDTPCDPDRLQTLSSGGVDVRLGWNEPQWDQAADLVVISPGIPPKSTLGRLAANVSCPVISEIEYGFRSCSSPILAVTGTNGKSTTVELIVHCLKHSNHEAVAAGNIGLPLSEAARKHSDADFLVVEVSSFQLERVQNFAPLVAALLNLAPDHLDRYPNLDAYYRTKTILFANMKRRDNIVLRRDVAQYQPVRDALPQHGGQPLVFASDSPGGADFFIDPQGNLCERTGNRTNQLLNRRNMRIRGRHNVENALAALAVCRAAGCDTADIAAALPSFAPYPHRLELVTVREGVQVLNDSKSTNLDSMCRALEAVGEAGRGATVLLIAGGLDKGLDFAAVKPWLRRTVKQVFLIGRAREKMAAQWKDVVPCMMFASMSAAVDAALESAGSGDTVLLSPGCASQDMFADYAERGVRFSELIKRRLGE